ncbi:DUF190 domain-containing protein [Patulibacter defluvii]|uniref:DUF190 domain-containing protein n=1 Tax=Patulibacter defluvii TaxID=3095358 RepID=UPI002A759172|nr:DUF190 domain-containing protein [Patulibacter sp. DM4]
MIDDGLRLSLYLGERDRAGRRFLADAVLDAFARHEVAASVLLRGALGFGAKQRLRSDRLLTLSEDLPVTAIAVDRRDRIAALAEEVEPLIGSGLVTVERTRIVRGPAVDPALPDDLREATKLTVYLGRRERVGGRPAFVAACALLHARGVDGATVLLGVDGTVRGRRARARFVGRNADVPLVLIAVGTGERIAAAVPELRALLHDPLITLERVRTVKRDGVRLADPPPLPERDREGLALWRRLTVHGSERTTVDGHPAHAAIVRGLRQAGGAGATTVRGLWGFHGDHPPHGDRLLQLRRGVPTVTTVVDTPARIAEALTVVDRLTPARGLVTVETVPALVAWADGERRGGLRLATDRS